MTVVSVDKNVEALTFTIVTEFDAGVERVWRIWEDPRQLERWWGPHATVKLQPLGDRTRMTLTSVFESQEQMEKMAGMGMEEGLRLAIEQIDALLGEPANA